MGLDLQRASISKRLAAFVIDFFIFILLCVLLTSLFSFVFGYKNSVDSLNAIYDKYPTKFKYDDLYTLDYEEYSKLSDDIKKQYQSDCEKFQEDKESQEKYITITTEIAIKSFLIISLSMLLTFVITELSIPMFLKNGQTIGKKLFSIGVVRVDLIKITPFQLFVRTIVGKFIIETLIPVMFLIFPLIGILGGGTFGIIIFAVYLLVQSAMFIFTKNKYILHDVLAVTVAVDMQTQMIFDSTDDLIAYKKKLHEEEVKNSSY